MPLAGKIAGGEKLMKSALIAGIGDVLLGDEGIGPHVIQQLEAQYDFSDEVVLLGLRTPPVELANWTEGLRALIVIDCVRSNEEPGTIVTYRKNAVLSIAPAQRLDPHGGALSGLLMTAGPAGASPESALLIGIAGKSYRPGEPISEAVENAVMPTIERVLLELDRLGYWYQEKHAHSRDDIWAEVLDLTRFESRE